MSCRLITHYTSQQSNSLRCAAEAMSHFCDLCCLSVGLLMSSLQYMVNCQSFLLIQLDVRVTCYTRFIVYSCHDCQAGGNNGTKMERILSEHKWCAIVVLLQGGPKMAQFLCTPQLDQILTNFQNYFSVRIRRKIVMILLVSLKIPPHRKCVVHYLVKCQVS